MKSNIIKEILDSCTPETEARVEQMVNDRLVESNENLRQENKKLLDVLRKVEFLQKHNRVFPSWLIQEIQQLLNK